MEEEQEWTCVVLGYETDEHTNQDLQATKQALPQTDQTDQLVALGSSYELSGCVKVLSFPTSKQLTKCV